MKRPPLTFSEYSKLPVDIQEQYDEIAYAGSAPEWINGLKPLEYYLNLPAAKYISEKKLQTLIERYPR